MSYIRYIKQTRLNTDIAFFSPTAEVVAKMDEYKSAGKIESYNLESISSNQLNKEIKITFDNETSFNEFVNEDLIIESKLARQTHCTNSSISYSLEEE
tara:strand:+ start:682 stop:975 length:294 start_codon:yes stop_codon:yes gene_type:complete